MRPWRTLPALQPVKRRLQRVQTAYWKRFRPLYCERIPTPAAARVLVVCPHIDDDVVGCGGVLRQHASAGTTVTSVYLRNGGPIREAEAHEAAKITGITDLVFLRWGPPPGRERFRRTKPGPAAEFQIDERAITGLREVVEQARPDIIYAPSFLDPHPDHAAAPRLLAAVAERGVRVGECYLYEVWSPLVPNALVDITPDADTKRRAIDAHRSQVETMDLAAAILGLNAYRAEMNRIHGYAEAYLRVSPEELVRMLADLDGRTGANPRG